MKYNWTKCLALLPLFGAGSLHAQFTYTTTEYIDINRFRIAHLVHGDMWYDAGSFKSACEYPKGSGKQMGSMMALWSSASDSFGHKDYVAAQSRFRKSGNDFWPGPLDKDTSTYGSSAQWARIWKINQKDIDRFNALPAKTITTVPAIILEWPAKGNPYAKGNAGAGLSITEDMAPFVDADGDGSYNPLKGDYPRIKGEQMLWWIFNDNGPEKHSASGGRPMKVEYRVSAYAYKRGGVLDNVVYYEFDLVNKSAVNYIDFRIGVDVDVDMVLPYDDYLASDTVYRMGITYDATVRENSHLLAVSLVEVPGDIYPTSMKRSAVFSYLETFGTGARRPPRTPAAFYNYMHGKDADGILYPDSPMEFPLTKGAIMCDEKYPLVDRRYYLNTSGFNFPAKSTRKVAMALLATDTTGNACGGMNLKELTKVADSAWKVYYNPLPVLSITETTSLEQPLAVYPNPTSHMLYIGTDAGKALNAGWLKVYDCTGRQIQLHPEQNGRQLSIDVSGLSPGLYALVYHDGHIQVSRQFVKQ